MASRSPLEREDATEDTAHHSPLAGRWRREDRGGLHFSTRACAGIAMAPCAVARLFRRAQTTEAPDGDKVRRITGGGARGGIL